MIHNPIDFSAVWEGDPHRQDLLIEYGPETALDSFGGSLVAAPFAVPSAGDARVTSHFGAGVLTFSIPYLFRTPSGVNLWVKGPSNYFKDGAHPLEGIVETDWSPATFTMNWKLTRPGFRVRFKRGEPICMVVPVARGLAEALEPVQMPLSSNPELEREYKAWSQSRIQFITAFRALEPDALDRGWQGEYTRGLTSGGRLAPEHQTRIQLKDFTRAPGEQS
jgi:hypothetical protein